MGLHGSPTAEIVFTDCIVPKENMLGKEGRGFPIAMQTLDGGRIGIAAQALGIAQGAYEAAVEYSKERIQFGKPICQQQNIAFKIADMATTRAPWPRPRSTPRAAFSSASPFPSSRTPSSPSPTWSWAARRAAS